MDSKRTGVAGAAIGPTLALTIAACVAAFGAFASIAHIALPATELPSPFPAQHQDAETLSFLAAFVVILPLSLLSVPRVATRIAAGGREQLLSGTAAGLSVLLLALLVAAKLVDRFGSADGAHLLLLTTVLWWVAAAVVVRSSCGDDPWTLRWVGRRARELWIASLVLLIVAVLAFVDLKEISASVGVVGLPAIAAVVYLYARWSPPALSGTPGLLVDLCAVALLLLAVPNLVVFDLSDGFQTRIIDFHQNFFIGPINQVLGGGGMLVDTLSQYGVGSIYFLAAWFEIAPIGNGTLGLAEGVLSALVFASAYLTIRLAGTSRVLAVTAMAVAVVALVYGLEYPLGGLLQHGAIRFGLPMIPLLAGTLELARPRYERPAQAVQLLAVGVASIWALEAFAYTLLTVSAMLAVRVWLRPAGFRRRSLLRWVGALAVTCLVVHVVLALATLVAYGSLPDWGLYLNTLREFLTGSIGDLTFDFPPWSPALAVGAFYLASAAGAVLLIRLHPDLARRRAAATVALAGSTAYGVALFSYFVNRSAAHILPYVCLPAIIAGVVWLGLLLAERERTPLRIRMVGLGGALGLSLILIASAWQGAGERLSQSTLAYVIPGGGPTLSDGLNRLWDPPDLAAGATSGAETLEMCMPGDDRSFVLTDADLGIEILAKTGRSNAFPLGDPWEDSFVPDHHLETLQAAVDDLEPSGRILVDPIALKTYRDYLREPDRNPLTDPFSEDAIVPTGIATLQEWLLKEIGRRYSLRPVCGPTNSDLPFVVELASRRSPK